MKLIVGLGNPGREYVGTRHNIGFEVLDAFAAKSGWIGSAGEFERQARAKFDGLALDGQVTLPGGGIEKVLLLKPMTYMNVSGRSVQAALAFYQVEPADLMVVLDDLALPCGKLRIRTGGSDGGHNGLKDIQRVLGTPQYPRLRVGIDPAPPRIPPRDYVLGRFSDEQRTLLAPAMQRSVDGLLTWIDKGINAAMNQFNTEAVKKDGEGDKVSG
jgi:PTH1 family peptidyl-tRNA hydrolase